MRLESSTPSPIGFCRRVVTTGLAFSGQPRRRVEADAAPPAVIRHLRTRVAVTSMFVAFGLLFLAAPSQAGQVYIWRDARGVLNYSDTPPPAGALDVKRLRVQEARRMLRREARRPAAGQGGGGTSSGATVSTSGGGATGGGMSAAGTTSTSTSSGGATSSSSGGAGGGASSSEDRHSPAAGARRAAALPAVQP